MHIELLIWREISKIWETKLWPGRSDIKSMSSMTDTFTYDLSIYEKYKPEFYGIIDTDIHEVVGVNSGHQTADGIFRSRGLYVDPAYRGRGLGISLLRYTIHRAKECHGCHTVWSYPKDTALKTYTSVGFVPYTDIVDNHCYVKYS